METVKKFEYLEIVDRQTGEVERISLDDKNVAVSVAFAASNVGLSLTTAWQTLHDGHEITTRGFIRRLA